MGVCISVRRCAIHHSPGDGDGEGCLLFRVVSELWRRTGNRFAAVCHATAARDKRNEPRRVRGARVGLSYVAATADRTSLISLHRAGIDVPALMFGGVFSASSLGKNTASLRLGSYCLWFTTVSRQIGYYYVFVRPATGEFRLAIRTAPRDSRR